MSESAQVKVTVTDLANGDTETAEITDDYVLTCAGSAYVDHVAAYASGTHVITVKGRKSAGLRVAGLVLGEPVAEGAGQ